MNTQRRTPRGLAARLVVSCLVTSCLVAFACPAFAGLYYEAKTTVDRGQGSSEVRSWIDGDNARIEFRDSDIPTVQRDNYLITHDGGKTFFMVNPKDKTVMEWDMAAAMNLLEGFSGMVDFEISDPQIEKLDDKDGGTMLGESTRYVRYRTSYDMKVKILGMKRQSNISTDQEMWLTDAHADALGLGAWLRKDRPTGNEDFDRLLTTEMSKVEGFPLKTVSVTTTTDRRGREQTSRSVTEVTVLRKESVDEKRFLIPPEFDRVDMLGGEEGSSNPLKGLFGRRGDG